MRNSDGSTVNSEGVDTPPITQEQPPVLSLEGRPELAPGVTIAAESDTTAEDVKVFPSPSVPPRPKPNLNLSVNLADRPLWQIVSGLGLGAIALTGVAIGLFTLSGLALQGLGRAVAAVIAGTIVLGLFSGIPMLLAVFTLQTSRAIQQQGVSAGTSKLVVGIAIAIGVMGGIWGRLL
ncbi:MAG: hypothetical protein EAZ61_05260 [Oscillatoriales cyanobacterium]|nr:MAG: hypothetical protein EAZ61_05260 [Oscillatoriales cyanobacterium]